jgi:hypothetical protein
MHPRALYLFRGRIVNRPEHAMPDALETSGGAAEHEVYMMEGTILIVIELLQSHVH